MRRDSESFIARDESLLISPPDSYNCLVEARAEWRCMCLAVSVFRNYLEHSPHGDNIHRSARQSVCDCNFMVVFNIC